MVLPPYCRPHQLPHPSVHLLPRLRLLLLLLLLQLLRPLRVYRLLLLLPPLPLLFTPFLRPHLSPLLCLQHPPCCQLVTARSMTFLHRSSSRGTLDDFLASINSHSQLLTPTP